MRLIHFCLSENARVIFISTPPQPRVTSLYFTHYFICSMNKKKFWLKKNILLKINFFKIFCNNFSLPKRKEVTKTYYKKIIEKRQNKNETRKCEILWRWKHWKTNYKQAIKQTQTKSKEQTKRSFIIITALQDFKKKKKRNDGKIVSIPE